MGEDSLLNSHGMKKEPGDLEHGPELAALEKNANLVLEANEAAKRPKAVAEEAKAGGKAEDGRAKLGVAAAAAGAAVASTAGAARPSDEDKRKSASPGPAAADSSAKQAAGKGASTEDRDAADGGDDNAGKSDNQSAKALQGPQSKGRFSKGEKKILFGLIREDSGLFHAFLHQRKERMYGTKSWMHEIAQRYNRKATEKRSLEAIRHHLMFRKTASSKSDKANEKLLFEHASTCQTCETCTKCLIFQRVCVQARYARCGYHLCSECDPNLPHVSKMIQGDLKDLPASLVGSRGGMGGHDHHGQAYHQQHQQHQASSSPSHHHSGRHHHLSPLSFGSDIAQASAAAVAAADNARRHAEMYGFPQQLSPSLAAQLSPSHLSALLENQRLAELTAAATPRSIDTSQGYPASLLLSPSLGAISPTAAGAKMAQRDESALFDVARQALLAQEAARMGLSLPGAGPGGRSGGLGASASALSGLSSLQHQHMLSALQHHQAHGVPQGAEQLAAWARMHAHRQAAAHADGMTSRKRKSSGSGSDDGAGGMRKMARPYGSS